MKLIIYCIVFALGFSLHYSFSFVVEAEFISLLLIISSIFFGFYITSFSVFATSKYLSKLYEKEDIKDNSMTLLDNLLEKFKWATYVLLFSIIYSVIVYVFIEINFFELIAYGVLGVFAINIANIFKTISYFIKITRQSAIMNR